jgi:hypothetical protein
MQSWRCRSWSWLKTLGLYCLKSWEGLCTAEAQLFVVSSFHLTALQNWHIYSTGGSWRRWTCPWTTSISLIAAPTNRSARRFLDALWCVALFLDLGCVRPVPLHLFSLRNAKCFALELSTLLLCSFSNGLNFVSLSA